MQLLSSKCRRKKVVRCVGSVVRSGLLVAVEFSCNPIAQFSGADMFIVQSVSIDGFKKEKEQPALCVARGSTHIKESRGKFLQRGERFGLKGMQRS